MIEIVCNDDKGNPQNDNQKSDSGQALKRKPKNIKQIGDVSSDKKIYIEDYAFTYINSIAYNNPSESQAGVLLGENDYNNEEKCVYIKGVIKAKLGDAADEKGVYFNENIWNGIYSDIEKYFPNLSVVGWFAAIPEVTNERMMKLKKMHLDNFAGTMKTFYLIDTVEKEENFYLYENGELRKQKGYVCFYERNYEMQEYMLERREKKSTETNDDKVMKSIRNIIKEKEEIKEQRKSERFMYGVSSFMVVVVLVISINLMNNYQKMQKFDKSINNLIVQMSGNNDVADNEGTVAVMNLDGGVYPTEAPSMEVSETVTNQVVEATIKEDVSQPSKNEEETQATQETQNKATSEITSGTEKIYVVKSGDTILGICKKIYGNSSKCQEIITYNNLGDGNLLFVGQEIKLP